MVLSKDEQDSRPEGKRDDFSWLLPLFESVRNRKRIPLKKTRPYYSSSKFSSYKFRFDDDAKLEEEQRRALKRAVRLELVYTALAVVIILVLSILL
ncbi:MAG: hypothetical protein JRN20_10860 [Nitrososphaerota archaeon]|nr:hypothetical protein [Nitrososphaerota archaeon]